MKRKIGNPLIIILLLCILYFVLQEGWMIPLKWSQSQQELTTSDEIVMPNLNGRELRYVEDDGRPFRPITRGEEDLYHVTVVYRIEAEYSPWRWLPFYKFGENKVQLTYLVWMENGLAGCGAITMSARQTMQGLASARDYERTLKEPLIAKMKEAVAPRSGVKPRS